MPQLFHKCRRGRIPQPHTTGSHWAGRGDSSGEKQIVVTRESPSSTGLSKAAFTAPGGFQIHPVCSSFMVWELSVRPIPGPGDARGLWHLLSMSTQASRWRLTTDPHNATALREQRRKHLATRGHPGRLPRGGGVCPELMLPSPISPRLLLGTAAQSSTELDTTHTWVHVFPDRLLFHSTRENTAWERWEWLTNHFLSRKKTPKTNNLCQRGKVLILSGCHHFF